MKNFCFVLVIFISFNLILLGESEKRIGYFFGGTALAGGSYEKINCKNSFEITVGTIDFIETIITFRAKRYIGSNNFKGFVGVGSMNAVVFPFGVLTIFNVPFGVEYKGKKGTIYGLELNYWKFLKIYEIDGSRDPNMDNPIIFPGIYFKKTI